MQKLDRTLGPSVFTQRRRENDACSHAPAAVMSWPLATDSHWQIKQMRLFWSVHQIHILIGKW